MGGRGGRPDWLIVADAAGDVAVAAAEDVGDEHWDPREPSDEDCDCSDQEPCFELVVGWSQRRSLMLVWTGHLAWCLHYCCLLNIHN